MTQFEKEFHDGQIKFNAYKSVCDLAEQIYNGDVGEAFEYLRTIFEKEAEYERARKETAEQAFNHFFGDTMRAVDDLSEQAQKLAKKYE